MCQSAPVSRSMKSERVRPVAQSQRGQLQSRGPAFGPRQQPEHVLLGQQRAGPFKPAAEELHCLGGAEPQVVGPQLGQVAAYPQAAERQRRVGPGEKHQVQLRRTAIQQRGHRRVHLGAGDEVVVVQHQDQRGPLRRQFVNERGEHVTQHVGAGRVQSPQRGGPRRRARLVGGEQQVPPEALGVVVAAVERNPARGDIIPGQPVGHDRALAPPGGRYDQGQRQRPPLAQQVMQPLALHGLLPEARPEQLGRDHDLGRVSRHPPPPPPLRRYPAPSVLLVTVTCDDKGRIVSPASRPSRARPAERVAWLRKLADGRREGQERGGQRCIIGRTSTVPPNRAAGIRAASATAAPRSGAS